MLIFFTLVKNYWLGTERTEETCLFDLQMIPTKFGSAKLFFSRPESNKVLIIIIISLTDFQM